MRRMITGTALGILILASAVPAQRSGTSDRSRGDEAGANAIIIEPAHPGWGQPSYPAYPTQPPVFSGPWDGGHGDDRVVIRHFERNGRIRENRRSTLYRTDARRTVDSIEVRWTDDREEARGRLLIDTGRGLRTLQDFDVSTPGRVRWDIRQRIAGFQIEALRDDIWIEEIIIHFDPRFTQDPGRPTRPSPHQPVISSPVLIFGGHGQRAVRVREDTVSPVFRAPGQTVIAGRVRVVWTDHREEAQGRLVLRGHGTRRYPARDVSSPGQGIWEVNGPVSGVQIAAEDDDLWIREVWLEP